LLDSLLQEIVLFHHDYLTQSITPNTQLMISKIVLKAMVTITADRFN